MHLKLLVLRTSDPQRLADFYGLLGLTFAYNKHGNSPYHYSATIGQLVLEIYPLLRQQANADTSLRLGFGIDNFEPIIQALQEHEAIFSAPPIQTDFGYLAIVTDPDGRKVELYKN